MRIPGDSEFALKTIISTITNPLTFSITSICKVSNHKFKKWIFAIFNNEIATSEEKAYFTYTYYDIQLITFILI